MVVFGHRNRGSRRLRLAAFRAVRLCLTDYASSFLEAMPPRRSLKIKTVLNGKAEPYRTEGGQAAEKRFNDDAVFL